MADSKVMKAKMWMLAGGIALVLMLVTCHTVFAAEITLTPLQAKVYQSYVRTIERIAEDKELEDLTEDLTHRLSLMGQCGAFRAYQAREAQGNHELQQFRIIQGTKLLDHFGMLTLAIATYNEEEVNVVQLQQQVQSQTIGMVKQFTAMLMEGADNRDEVYDNVSYTCDQESAKVEGREHTVMKVK